MHKVTIAIPTYNRREFLSQCLESIAQQTRRDFEVIVFDNHSDYDVNEVISQFPGLTVRLEGALQNMGQHWNFVRMFTYPYITPYAMVFHDDDCMHPRLLEVEVGAMEAHPDAAWAASTPRFVQVGKDMLRFSSMSGEIGYSLCDSPNLIRRLLGGYDLCTSSILYKAALLEDDTPFEQKYSKWSDRPQVITIAKGSRVALFDAGLVNYRVHPSQDSAQKMDRGVYMKYAKNLFGFYRENLPQPLSKADRLLWYRFTTNNLISSLFNTTSGIREFWQALRDFGPEFFQWKYLRPKGVYYMLKGLLMRLLMLK